MARSGCSLKVIETTSQPTESNGLRHSTPSRRSTYEANAPESDSAGDDHNRATTIRGNALTSRRVSKCSIQTKRQSLPFSKDESFEKLLRMPTKNNSFVETNARRDRGRVEELARDLLHFLPSNHVVRWHERPSYKLLLLDTLR